MADVTHRVTDDGTHQIGIEDDGVFVPFATLDEARFNQLKQAGENEPGREAAEEPEGGEE
jgi:hypothetical protein